MIVSACIAFGVGMAIEWRRKAEMALDFYGSGVEGRHVRSYSQTHPITNEISKPLRCQYLQTFYESFTC